MNSEANKPSGCLLAVLRLLRFLLGVSNEADSAGGSAALPYRLRDDFLSQAEFSFYRVLQLTVGDRVVICPKVNLNDLFFVAQPHENQRFRNKIDRKHVDFVLCDPQSMKPLAGIELDDSSHRRSDRQARDAFVDEVFEVAGLELVRFPVQASYNIKEIAAKLAPHLTTPPVNEPSPPPVARPQTRTTASPNCPKCQTPMVRRVATKGANQGKRFWGCPNYPKCRHVVR